MIPGFDLSSWASSAVGGSMALAVPVALLAGLVSFFSPCVVPLLPGYLSYATGLGAAEVVAGGRRGRMLAGTLLFVLGLAAVFVTTGVVAGAAGQALYAYQTVITRVIGSVIIILGLIFAGLLPLGNRELRISWVPTAGVAAAPLLGIVFGLGWSPCIGPALGVVINLGFNEATALRGGVLGLRLRPRAGHPGERIRSFRSSTAATSAAWTGGVQVVSPSRTPRATRSMPLATSAMPD